MEDETDDNQDPDGGADAAAEAPDSVDGADDDTPRDDTPPPPGPDATPVDGVGPPPVDAEGASPAASSGSGPSIDLDGLTEETVVALIAERDEYLDALQRLKADFSNHRKRSADQAAAQRQQAAAELVTKLLPVLDSAEAALEQGVDEVRPITDALFDVLASAGLARLDPVGEEFNPEMHEAVMFESSDDTDPTQVVTETMRLGYAWNERVLRAAMVKVRG